MSFRASRVLPELGRDLHHDVILLRTVRVVDRRYLRLCEGISQRVVDLAGRQPQSSRAVAIDDQIRFQAARLQITVHIGQFGDVLQRVAQLVRPRCAVPSDHLPAACTDIPSWRSAHPTAKILCRLQKRRHPVILHQLRPQPLHDAIGRRIPLRQWLQRHADLCRSGTAAERVRRLHPRSRPRCCTPGSACTIAVICLSFDFISWKEESASPRTPPQICPVSCCGKNPFGITT
jgi:ribosomal 50S subunit-recycling heat shock protein